jgi:hypothetical protein
MTEEGDGSEHGGHIASRATRFVSLTLEITQKARSQPLNLDLNLFSTAEEVEKQTIAGILRT